MMVTTDRQSQQTKRYQDEYQYQLKKAESHIESFVFGVGLDLDLEEAVKCAIAARQCRIEFDRLGSFNLKTEDINTD